MHTTSFFCNNTCLKYCASSFVSRYSFILSSLIQPLLTNIPSQDQLEVDIAVPAAIIQQLRCSHPFEGQYNLRFHHHAEPFTLEGVWKAHLLHADKIIKLIFLHVDIIIALLPSPCLTIHLSGFLERQVTGSEGREIPSRKPSNPVTHHWI